MKPRKPLPRPSKHLKRSRLKQGRRKKPRPEGHVDEAYKAWCRLQDCRVAVALNSWRTCQGPMEPHHAGEHGLSQLPPDSTCIPLCFGCHDNRHRGLGFFKGMPKAERRAWEDEQVGICRAMYAEDGGIL